MKEEQMHEAQRELSQSLLNEVKYSNRRNELEGIDIVSFCRNPF